MFKTKDKKLQKVKLAKYTSTKLKICIQIYKICIKNKNFIFMNVFLK